MSESWRLELAERKVSTFTNLYFENKATYGDAILILTAVVSALASQCWPGKARGIDRGRFTQLLVDHAPETRTISVPLLMKHFESSKRADLAEKLEGHFDRCVPWRTIPLGHEVDLSEKDVEHLLGGSSCRSEVRKHSYSHLLYKELRCSYSHEFKPGAGIEVNRPTSFADPCVSYQPYSILLPGSSELSLTPTSFSIYFDLPWIGEVLRKCAGAVDSMDDRLPLEPPDKWWIDDGDLPTSEPDNEGEKL